MRLEQLLTPHLKGFFKKDYQKEIKKFEFQQTRKEFKGDITLVVFPLLKYIKTNPAQLAKNIGDYLKSNLSEIKDYNVIKGFLNLELQDDYLIQVLDDIYNDDNFGKKAPNGQKLMVEFSSPNTNKPLHLGHIRNITLGFAVAQIMEYAGFEVFKTQIINDRGIHICKSMLAWQKFGHGETPESTGMKGDHLVGKYYVRFDLAYKKQIQELVDKGITKDEAKAKAPILKEAQDMLKRWEKGDEEVVALWEKMNRWVYKGFDKTYKSLGVDFDKNYYESQTYLFGKDTIQNGLDKGIFFKKPDGSVWIDLSDEGLDEKIVLRADGTSVYMTQDIGTAIKRIEDFGIDKMVYTVGNEQDYHFKVLFLILKNLGYDWADNLYHLSYGMVDLPSGKMKSREGTVVDADDLIQDMALTAKQISEEHGRIEEYDAQQQDYLYQTIGLGALKYFILKVDPKKRIVFDPQKSVDFQGNTGPFIQYTYARIQSILRQYKSNPNQKLETYRLDEKESELIKILDQFPNLILQSAEQYSPALLANYTYELVKSFNSFYQNLSILGAESDNQKLFRVKLSASTAKVIKIAFKLLGIDVPDKM
ncbi:arginine--tRNA ligase [Mesohalobacter halotolerans]|uniref:Arginine--tRNA ligase n=1 Tax=Mesohalobacter halotolerans TaxID=1883405 RepID=A0A4V6ANP0_9FLAO|nr:arginine--tRNA ligase [Mesohalobacter halotolerans]MBS3738188.1 arginine--tRNA ligase [Psychroflexus sp.]TKS55545.1 arginine--tRNA ligase [Mesohalobacter halotolerans]